MASGTQYDNNKYTCSVDLLGSAIEHELWSGLLFCIYYYTFKSLFTYNVGCGLLYIQLLPT